MKKLDFPGFSVVVNEATALAGIRRGRMKYEAYQAEQDPDRRILRGGAYVDCVSGTTEHSGDYPADFDHFALLPERIVDEWLEAVYAENPHWNPINYQADEVEKKVETSESG